MDQRLIISHGFWRIEKERNINVKIGLKWAFIASFCNTIVLLARVSWDSPSCVQFENFRFRYHKLPENGNLPLNFLSKHLHSKLGTGDHHWTKDTVKWKVGKSMSLRYLWESINWQVRLVVCEWARVCHVSSQKISKKSQKNHGSTRPWLLFCGLGSKNENEHWQLRTSQISGQNFS